MITDRHSLPQQKPPLDAELTQRQVQLIPIESVTVDFEKITTSHCQLFVRFRDTFPQPEILWPSVANFEPMT